jgi:hypothetical protein
LIAEFDDDELIVDERQCQARGARLHSGPLRAERPEARQNPMFAEMKKWSHVMKKTLVTLALGATVAIGAIASPTPADARWRHGFPVAPIVGGLAAGALLGVALAAPRPYYGYAYEPVAFGPRCYVRRERFWDGWGWHVRRVEDCY